VYIERKREKKRWQIEVRKIERKRRKSTVIDACIDF